jgi:uncharacterized membrane protein YkoI
MKKTLTLLLAGALLASPAFADEKERKLAEADVPKAVLDAVTKRFPTASARTFEKEKQGQFEAELQVRDGAKVRRLSLELSAAGEILGEEEALSFDELPEAVKQAFRSSKFSGAKIEGVERELKAGKTRYEIEVLASDGKRELVFEANGALVTRR